MSMQNVRGATITNGNVVANGQQYALANLATVSLIRPVLSRTIGWIVAVVGLIILVAGYLVWGVLLTPIVAGAALLIAGLVVAFTVKESYTVRLNMKNGPPVLLQFADQAEAQRTVTAIGAAIDQQRGPDEHPLEREVGA